MQLTTHTTTLAAVFLLSTLPTLISACGIDADAKCGTQTIGYEAMKTSVLKYKGSESAGGCDKPNDDWKAALWQIGANNDKKQLVFYGWVNGKGDYAMCKGNSADGTIICSC